MLVLVAVAVPVLVLVAVYVLDTHRVRKNRWRTTHDPRDAHDAGLEQGEPGLGGLELVVLQRVYGFDGGQLAQLRGHPFHLHNSNKGR